MFKWSKKICTKHIDEPIVNNAQFILDVPITFEGSDVCYSYLENTYGNILTEKPIFEYEKQVFTNTNGSSDGNIIWQF